MFKSTLLGIFCLSLSLVMGQDVEAVAVGDSQLDVEIEMGQPDGWVQRGDVKIFLYDSTIVEIEKGVVTKIDIRSESSQSGSASEAYSPPSQPTYSTPPAEEKPKKKRSTAQLIKDVRKGGKKVSQKSLLVKGEITVVAFYADW